MTGLLEMYFPAEDPMNPAALLPQGLLGPSVLSRMQAHSGVQQARLDRGDYAPTRMNEDAMLLADDLAGGMLGTLGKVGMLGRKFTTKRAPANFRQVVVDVGKLDDAWRAGPEWVGEGAEIAGRRDRFRNWLSENPSAEIRTSEVGGLDTRLARDAEGRPIKRPDGTFEVVRVPVFSDGRHRFSVLRDEGVQQVPVAVNENIAEEFARLFGAAEP